MKYIESSEVILLDNKGNYMASAIIRSYEPSTKLYRINYRLLEVKWIIVENVSEKRLREI